MSGTSPEIYIDLPVLLDYCRTHIEECQPTRQLLDLVDRKGARLEMNDDVYDFWDQSVLNMQALLHYLKDEASQYSLKEDYDDPGEKFANNTLTLENLNSQESIGYQIEQAYNKEISSHIEYIDEHGFTDYRTYLDTHLQNCSRAHSKMDGMIDNRFGPGSVDRFWVKTELESFSEYDQHLTSLVNGHYWCKSGGDLFLVRGKNRVSYDIDDLQTKLLKNTNHEISVASPSQVLESLH
jgi:hypothetical protein